MAKIVYYYSSKGGSVNDSSTWVAVRQQNMEGVEWDEVVGEDLDSSTMLNPPIPYHDRFTPYDPVASALSKKA